MASPDEVRAIVGLGLAVTRAYFPLRALSDRVLGPAGSSTARMAILRTIATEGPTTVAELAQARPVARQGVRRVANELVADGVLTWVDQEGQRARLLALTEAGEAHFHELVALQVAWSARLASQVDPATAEATTRGLEQLREALLGVLELLDEGGGR